MNKFVKILLILIAVGCLGTSLAYLIPYFMESKETESEMDSLSELHRKAMTATVTQIPMKVSEGRNSTLATFENTESFNSPSPAPVPEITALKTSGDTVLSETSTPSAANLEETERPEASAGPVITGTPDTEATVTPQEGETPTPEGTALPTPTATRVPHTPTPEPIDGEWDSFLITLKPKPTDTPVPTASPTPSPVPTETPVPTPTPDRNLRSGGIPYAAKEKVVLDKTKILEELKELYAMNEDLIGWLSIPDTNMDYPVVQPKDAAGMEYYLDYDFLKKKNMNGAIILDCDNDPFTPSYNLVISGHHLSNGQMFSHLTDYENQSFWETHPIFTFDTLMERNTYVIFAAFRSAKWADNEEGFRYHANFTTKYEFDPWLEEVMENRLYDTGVQVAFGDECVTLTTCNRAYRREGRFVVVARKLREGEVLPWMESEQ